ncbi:MAG TPA: type II toxin-antitoxin system VapC family toxin, partial [Polyangia bacterium]|nr:type II toxin-antitoxin system VapC family toxin [Polyangia bacterium]
MKLLLDTCTFLWMALGDRALSRPAREALADPANDVYLSATSSWEIALKHALGKLPLPEQPTVFV